MLEELPSTKLGHIYFKMNECRPTSCVFFVFVFGIILCNLFFGDKMKLKEKKGFLT